MHQFVEEKMRGIDTLEGMRQLAEEVDANWDGVQAKLERIRDLMVDRRNLIVNLSAEDKGFSGMPPRAPSGSCWQAAWRVSLR
jgi:Zn-dependent M16 (insulinase) family peptidase